MTIKERISQAKQKIVKLKGQRNILTKVQVFKFQPFSRRQKQILTWWAPDSPVKDYDGIIADGAIRSGKTVCMSLSFVMWAMATFSGQNFAMCGKTIGSFRRNVLFWLKLMLKSRGYRVMDHRADNLVEISRGAVTNYFYIFGGKDERSQDLIQGITLAGLFCDEVALMPESFVNQATGRCSVAGSKYWFNCNPDGPYHWFKVNWIDKAIGYLGKKKAAKLQQEAVAKGTELNLKKLLYVHFTMDDNLSLSEAIKADIAACTAACSLSVISKDSGRWLKGSSMTCLIRTEMWWTQKPLRRNTGRKPDGSSGSATNMSAVTMVPRTRRRSCCGARELITSGTAAGSIIIPDAIKGSRRQTKNLLKI